MQRVESAYNDKRFFSINDEFIVGVIWENPNDANSGAGINADKGTIVVQKTCNAETSFFWIKYDSNNPKSWRTWGEGQPRYVVTFGYDGNAVASKWLEAFHSVPSNVSPYIVPENSTLRALAVSVNGTASAVFRVYKNTSTLLDTLTLTAASTAYKANLTHLLVPGDTLSVELYSGSAKDITFYPSIQVNMVP